MDMSPPTPFDMESYPRHVMLTSDSTWNPIVFDDEYLVEDVELEEGNTIPYYGMDRVNDFGQLLNRMAGFGLYPPQVAFGRLFYVSTEITIVIIVIKQFFQLYTINQKSA
jgi:hypothetical protein